MGGRHEGNNFLFFMAVLRALRAECYNKENTKP